MSKCSNALVGNRDFELVIQCIKVIFLSFSDKSVEEYNLGNFVCQQRPLSYLFLSLESCLFECPPPPPPMRSSICVKRCKLVEMNYFMLV